jgi:hypothetical protein
MAAIQGVPDSCCCSCFFTCAAAATGVWHITLYFNIDNVVEHNRRERAALRGLEVQLGLSAAVKLTTEQQSMGRLPLADEQRLKRDAKIMVMARLHQDVTAGCLGQWQGQHHMVDMQSISMSRWTCQLCCASAAQRMW